MQKAKGTLAILLSGALLIFSFPAQAGAGGRGLLATGTHARSGSPFPSSPQAAPITPTRGGEPVRLVERPAPGGVTSALPKSQNKGLPNIINKNRIQIEPINAPGTNASGAQTATFYPSTQARDAARPVENRSSPVQVSPAPESRPNPNNLGQPGVQPRQQGNPPGPRESGSPSMPSSTSQTAESLRGSGSAQQVQLSMQTAGSMPSPAPQNSRDSGPPAVSSPRSLSPRPTTAGGQPAQPPAPGVPFNSNARADIQAPSFPQPAIWHWHDPRYPRDNPGGVSAENDSVERMAGPFLTPQKFVITLGKPHPTIAAVPNGQAPESILPKKQVETSTQQARGLCRKLCLGGREGAMAPVGRGLKRPGSRTVRPQ